MYIKAEGSKSLGETEQGEEGETCWGQEQLFS